MIELYDLAEEILNEPAPARKAIGWLLDEVLGKDVPLGARSITRHVNEDVARIGKYLRARFAAGKMQRPRFKALALVLGESVPYGLQLALVNASLEPPEWPGSIVWSDDTTSVEIGLVNALLPRVPKSRFEAANYILPLAYAAFVARDVLRAASPAHWKPAREATVIYSDGDELIVPMT